MAALAERHRREELALEILVPAIVLVFPREYGRQIRVGDAVEQPELQFAQLDRLADVVDDPLGLEGGCDRRRGLARPRMGAAQDAVPPARSMRAARKAPASAACRRPSAESSTR